MSDTRIGFGNALELGECGLLPLIAERNSSLGRQKQESTRFIYEWKLKKGLEQCTQFAEEVWFQRATEAKTRDVEIAILRLLIKSEESDRIHSKLSPPFESLSASRVSYVEKSEPVLTVLLRALNNKNPPDTDAITEFEEALQRWSQTQHHGTLHRTIVETLDWLVIANEIQTAAIQQNTMCPMGTPTQRGRNLQQFVNEYFAKTVQPKLSAVMQTLDHFNTQWNAVPIASRTPEDFVNALLRLPANTQKTLKSRLNQHIQNWQQLLQSCGLSVRAETTNS